MRKTTEWFDNLADSEDASYIVEIWYKNEKTGINDRITKFFNSKLTQELPDGNLSIGNAIAAEFTFSLTKEDLPEDSLENKLITLSVRLAPEGTTAMPLLVLGEFKIMDVSVSAEVYTYKAYDAMVFRLDKKMQLSSLGERGRYRTNIAVENVCKAVGVKNYPELEEYLYVLMYLPSDMTYRTFIGYMAAFYGANAMFIGSYLVFRKFSTDTIDYTGGELRSSQGQYRIDENCYYESGLTLTSESPFVVGKVVCQYGSGESDVITAGNGNTGIGFYNPFLSDQAPHVTVMEDIFRTLCGLPKDTKMEDIEERDYLKNIGLECKMLGDFRLEIGDKIWIKKGNTYYAPIITQIEHEFDGGLVTTIRSTVDNTKKDEINISKPVGSTSSGSDVDMAEIKHKFANGLELSGMVLKLISGDGAELDDVNLVDALIGIRGLEFAAERSLGYGSLYLDDTQGKNFGRVKIVGTGATKVTSDAGGDIIVESTDKDTTYTPGAGLSMSGTTINHSNNITAGTAGSTGSQTLKSRGNFTVPAITYDAQGHITGKGEKTYTLPQETIADITGLQEALNGKAIANHTHNYAGSSSPGGAATTALTCTGNAVTASKLQTGRTISLTGDVAGFASTDFSSNVSIVVDVKDNSHSHTISNITGLQDELNEKVGIATTAVMYQAGASGTTVPTGTWTVTIPTVSANQYLWTRIIFTYTNGATSIAYSVGRIGANGATGATGKGIKSTVITYQRSDSGTTVPTGTWTTNIPSVPTGWYMWTRTVLTYTDNTTSTSYSISKMGATGDKGDSGIIISASTPANPTIGQLWQTATGAPIRRWTGSAWVIHYISVENLSVQNLSAISANLGTVTAGTIKSSDDTMLIDVANGSITSYNDSLISTVDIKAGNLSISGKDQYTNNITMGLLPGEIYCRQTFGSGSVVVDFDTGNTQQGGDMLINDTPVLGTFKKLSSMIKIRRLVKTVSIPVNANASFNMGSLAAPSGYEYVGILPVENGYGDQWQVTYAKYGPNGVFAYVKSYYGATLQASLQCNVVFIKSGLFSYI